MDQKTPAQEQAEKDAKDLAWLEERARLLTEDNIGPSGSLNLSTMGERARIGQQITKLKLRERCRDARSYLQQTRGNAHDATAEALIDAVLALIQIVEVQLEMGEL